MANGNGSTEAPAEKIIWIEEMRRAQQNLRGIAVHTPLILNENLSAKYDANVYLKREDLQPVRSYKLRGAYHKISNLSDAEKQKGVICASAGNHAQGVAYSCEKLGVPGTVVMPVTTPKQKINQVRLFGKDYVKIILHGDTFDDAGHFAQKLCREESLTFIHPFDDEMVISGQGTIGLEILEDFPRKVDYVFVPIGGGGLAAGISLVFKELSPETKIVGVEPKGAASMQNSLNLGENTMLDQLDKFVDGAAVKRVGDLNFKICRQNLADVFAVPEGKICTTILSLYNENGIVVEPAGALSITALDFYREQIRGKNVVCVVSGSNNDIMRMEEIKERSLLYEGLKHYFVINFPQRAGALRKFMNDVLSPNDDITYFQYIKKNNRETGPAVVGIEVKESGDVDLVKERLQKNEFNFQYLNGDEQLFSLIVG